MGIEKLPLIAISAVKAESGTGCPAELMAAQCIVESGWLNYAPGLNCFGIKSYAGEFGRQLIPTTEWFTDAELHAFLGGTQGRTATAAKHADGSLVAISNGRRLYDVKDWFATFESLADCFAKRGALFSQGPYAKFATAYKLNGDITALVNGIGPIYATDPHYATTILQIINQQNVKDAIATARSIVDPPTPTPTPTILT